MARRSGQVELADAVFGAKVNQHLLHEASRWYLRGLRSGHAQDQGQERSQRRGPQAVAAEGHWPRARRLDSFAALAPWRHGPRTEAARLQLRVAEENAARRAALGAVGEARGTEVDRRGRTGSSRTTRPRRFREALGKLNHKKSALIVAHGENRNLELASRNSTA